VQLLTASLNESQTTARSKTSTAPVARTVAWLSGKDFGFTKIKFSTPMVLAARATAPMLPGCEGSTSTIWIWLDLFTQKPNVLIKFLAGSIYY